MRAVEGLYGDGHFRVAKEGVGADDSCGQQAQEEGGFSRIILRLQPQMVAADGNYVRISLI